MNFESIGGFGSKISPEGKAEITVDIIDNIVGDDYVTFIKLDIEGAELEALRGARRTIAQNSPRIAVCIYHKPDDFIDIPMFFMSKFPQYKLYIRKYSYSWDFYDVILYAVT